MFLKAAAPYARDRSTGFVSPCFRVMIGVNGVDENLPSKKKNSLEVWETSRASTGSSLGAGSQVEKKGRK